MITVACNGTLVLKYYGISRSGDPYIMFKVTAPNKKFIKVFCKKSADETLYEKASKVVKGQHVVVAGVMTFNKEEKNLEKHETNAIIFCKAISVLDNVKEVYITAEEDIPEE